MRPLWRALRAAPPPVQAAASVVTILVMFAALNIVYHVIRKPTEMFFPVAGALNKLPAATWREYGPLFRANATATITPELLAALAQVEGAGNPVARTYWRWRFSWNPFAIYQPASSAVGMYQMTDGTFAEARRYCIHDHRVVEDGPWHDFSSCWFNALYTRVVPSHAVELTAACSTAMSQAYSRAAVAPTRRCSRSRTSQRSSICAAPARPIASRGAVFASHRASAAATTRPRSTSLRSMR